MAPTAQAEGIRSLGVTVAPGALAVTRVRSGVATGLSGSIDWELRWRDRWWSFGGHLTSSGYFTDATTLRLRLGPQLGRARPFAGMGVSLLWPWHPELQSAAGASALRIGGELCAGVGLEIRRRMLARSCIRGILVSAFGCDRAVEKLTGRPPSLQSRQIAGQPRRT